MDSVDARPVVGRRRFLAFRSWRPHCTIEISCQRLHLNYVSLAFTGVPADTEDPRGGHEPPTVHALRTVDDLLGELRTDLVAARIVRVVGPRWLVPTELERIFDELLDEFRRRGGIVEYVG